MKEKFNLFAIIAVCILAPIAIGWGVSQDILNDWTNSNDWIGFWGSYLGAIFGGLVSLYVMRYTIKNTEKAAEISRKKEFCDSLLAELIDYHVTIKHFANQLATPEEIDMDKAVELSKRSELLVIKVVAKQNDKNYICSSELKKSLDELTQSFNILLDFRATKSIVGPCGNLYKDCIDKADQFIDAVEEFYKKNSI